MWRWFHGESLRESEMQQAPALFTRGANIVFDVTAGEADENGKRSRRMEHYWLCGVCAQTMAMEQSADGVRVVARRRGRVQEIPLIRSAIAS